MKLRNFIPNLFGGTAVAIMLVLVFIGSAQAGSAQTAASPPLFGVHDSGIKNCDHNEAAKAVNPQDLAQARASFEDPNWAGLHTNQARVVVPWNIAADFPEAGAQSRAAVLQRVAQGRGQPPCGTGG